MTLLTEQGSTACCSAFPLPFALFPFLVPPGGAGGELSGWCSKGTLQTVQEFGVFVREGID